MKKPLLLAFAAALSAAPGCAAGLQKRPTALTCRTPDGTTIFSGYARAFSNGSIKDKTPTLVTPTTVDGEQITFPGDVRCGPRR
jgi:hypothetical protein